MRWNTDNEVDHTLELCTNSKPERLREKNSFGLEPFFSIVETKILRTILTVDLFVYTIFALGSPLFLSQQVKKIQFLTCKPVEQRDRTVHA